MFFDFLIIDNTNDVVLCLFTRPMKEGPGVLGYLLI